MYQPTYVDNAYGKKRDWKFYDWVEIIIKMLETNVVGP